MSNKGMNDGQGTSDNGGAVPPGSAGDGLSGDNGAVCNDHDMGEDGEANEGDIQESSQSSGASGPLPWEVSDAGFGDEYQNAEIETKKAVLRIAADALKGDEAALQARMEPDLVKRAKALMKLGAIVFPEEKPVNTGGMTVMQPLPSDVNMWAVLDALFGPTAPERPYFDTFRGRSITHESTPLDGQTKMVDLTLAMSAVGLKGLRTASLKEAYKIWISNVQMNSLQHRFERLVPNWDGESRLETLLIKLMKPIGTELNRKFGKYFWLSLYQRIHNPGCFAPMVLSLFGGQNAGKSYMSKVICEELVGPGSNAVELDLSAIGNGTFLRAITGASVVANIGEMAGFTKGDLNKIKSFITKDTDAMDYKYESHVMQRRQWVIVMDGNNYDGLQRDESGNRRFYPVFCGQLADSMGRPAWDVEFRADYTNFRSEFWQVMAECRAWMEEKGEDGYLAFVREVVEMVKIFSENEMKADRGTIRDDMLDAYFIPMMRFVRRGVYKGKKKSGVFIKTADMITAYNRFDRKGRLHLSHLKTKLSSLGGIPDLVKNERGYLFPGIEHMYEFNRLLGIATAVDETAPDEDALELVELHTMESGDGDGGDGGF